ncbi:MAG: PIN domain-containing protein, partial [Cytophagales bacterium]|nr:PIN domain-containing protein [Cytophagales bacterium]
MSQLVAFFDANVFYSNASTDFFMFLIKQNLFRATWSNRVHEEWMEALLKNYPHLSRENLERRRDLMNKNGGDCVVVDYEHLVSKLVLPDANDRHVLAAAIQAKAQVIVTYNLKDFPLSATTAYGIEAQHPDEFIMDLTSLAPEAVATAAREHRASLKNPPKTVD